MITEPAQMFSRRFWGYDPSAVDARVEVLTTKQQFLLNDVESLRAKLKDSGDEAAALRKQVVLLTDTSSSPHALQQRMTDVLRRAVDDAVEMRADAQAEAEALVAAAEADVEATHRKHQDALAELSAQKKALQAEHDETKESSRPTWPICVRTLSGSARSYLPTRRKKLIATANRPLRRWTRRVSNDSRCWSS